MRRPRARSRILKKVLPERLEEIRREKDVAPNAIEVWFADVPRQAQDEGARWPEEQDHPPVDQARNASERTRRAARRSGRLASLRPTDCPAQYHAHPIAGKMPVTEPTGKRLAVHARQLTLEPNVQILRRHRRPMLRPLEQARRSAHADHGHRTARMAYAL